MWWWRWWSWENNRNVVAVGKQLKFGGGCI